MRWIYFGVFLDRESKDRNLQVLDKLGIELPSDWKMFNHHMTIAFNNGSESSERLYDYYSDSFGELVNLTVDGIGVSEEAIAVRVRYNNPIANKIPHITIATPIDGKPVNSNKITKWFDIIPYTIQGKIDQFAK